MIHIAMTALLAGAPVNGLGDDPEITIRRLDTGATVVIGDAMVDVGGDGLHTYAFTPVAGLRYSFLIDADPSLTGQVDLRYFDGAFDGQVLDLWKARGADPDNPKLTLENTVGADYDEDAGAGVHIDQVKAGNLTTSTRVP